MSPETLAVQPLLARAFWALAILAFGLLVFRAANSALLLRANRTSPPLEELRPGTPTLLYFTTPVCAPCKTMQRPAIQRLIELTGKGLQVVEIDASARPEVASQWGVLSVPTTFVIDASGQARHVNHGVASTEKLLRQLNDIL
jgi:thiol-disulfide isomerase/thioredoxin